MLMIGLLKITIMEVDQQLSAKVSKWNTADYFDTRWQVNPVVWL